MKNNCKRNGICKRVSLGELNKIRFKWEHFSHFQTYQKYNGPKRNTHNGYIYGNLTAASDYGKATIFIKFFCSVFVHSSFLLPSTDNLPTLVVSLGDISITEPDVYTTLASLDPSKAHGIDAIGPTILKYCAAALCQPIHHLFMLSLSQHYIPEEWRIHTIIPIFKSGDHSSVLCYRPISLLCSISKVLERIMYNATVKFTILKTYH